MAYGFEHKKSIFNIDNKNTFKYFKLFRIFSKNENKKELMRKR